MGREIRTNLVEVYLGQVNNKEREAILTAESTMQRDKVNGT